MFIRYLVIDPQPKNPLDDTIVFQIPENSRQEELFISMLETSDLEYVKIEAPKPSGRGRKKAGRKKT